SPRPTPCPAPVTMATLPSRMPMSSNPPETRVDVTPASQYGTAPAAVEAIAKGDAVAVDTSVKGKPIPGGRVVLERGPAANFAKALTDTNPVYQDPEAARAAGFDNLPVAPTYPFAWSHAGAFPEIQPDNAGAPN